MGHPLSTGHWAGTGVGGRGGGECGVNKTGRGLAPLAPPSSLSLPQGFGLRRPLLLPSINALSGEPAFGSQFTSGQIQSPRGGCVCVHVHKSVCLHKCCRERCLLLIHAEVTSHWCPLVSIAFLSSGKPLWIWRALHSHAHTCTHSEVCVLLCLGFFCSSF